MWKKDWIYTVMAIFLVSLIFIGAILEAVDEHAKRLEEGPRQVAAQYAGENASSEVSE